LDARRLPPADRGRHDRVHAEDVGEPSAGEAVRLGTLRLRHQAVDVRGSARDVPDSDADPHPSTIAQRRDHLEPRRNRAAYLLARQGTVTAHMSLLGSTTSPRSSDASVTVQVKSPAVVAGAPRHGGKLRGHSEGGTPPRLTAMSGKPGPKAGEPFVTAYPAGAVRCGTHAPGHAAGHGLR